MRMRIRIGKDGKTTIAVEGGNGTNCLEFTKTIEERLGKVAEREMLPEAVDETVTVKEQQNVAEGGF
jgi:hypothetical protein